MEIIKLNIIPNGITPICHASQFDIKRKIGIALFDNMDPYNLSGEETVSLSVRKPDKTIITKTLEFEAGNYLEFETTEQMCAIAGENKCEIKISYDDMTIGSLNFIMQVERDPLYKGIQSESEIENLQEQVNTAVAAAVSGQYDSENVIFDSEPTLNNNIPYTVTSDGIKRALNQKADLSALSADNISFDNTGSGLSATDVDEAIKELESDIPEIPSSYAASAVTYDNTQSGLSSNNAQDVIDELETEISNIPTSYDANEIGYDNTNSGLSATDVQDAIDETARAIGDLSYKSGDIITFNFQQLFCRIDSSGKRISVFIPLNKRIPSNSTITASGNYSVYYYDGSSLLSNHDIANDTQSIQITPIGIVLTITLTTALSQTLGYGSIELRNTFTLTFS